MSKSPVNKKTVAAVSFATSKRLRETAARAKKMFGKRSFSRYIRHLVDTAKVKTK